MCPMPRALYSSTSVLVSGATRSAVSGRPSSLLNEPSAATVGPAAANTAASRSFVDVLPDDPVTPTTVQPTAATTAAASAPRAAWASSTTTAGPPVLRVASEATAPAATAAAAKS